MPAEGYDVEGFDEYEGSGAEEYEASGIDEASGIEEDDAADGVVEELAGWLVGVDLAARVAEGVTVAIEVSFSGANEYEYW